MAERDYSHRTLIEKLGVKPEHRVALIGLTDGAIAHQIASAAPDASTRLRKHTDVIVYQADTVPALARLSKLQPSIKRDGMIWLITPKGKRGIAYNDMLDAAKAAGLVDVKISASAGAAGDDGGLLLTNGDAKHAVGAVFVLRVEGDHAAFKVIPAGIAPKGSLTELAPPATQPIDAPSCGSVFKNPPGSHAGRLIEAAGLKGEKHGGAQISTLHANFIVNTGGATAADVLALIGHARAAVRLRTGVLLEPEVRIWGRNA